MFYNTVCHVRIFGQTFFELCILPKNKNKRRNITLLLMKAINFLNQKKGGGRELHRKSSHKTLKKNDTHNFHFNLPSSTLWLQIVIFFLISWPQIYVFLGGKKRKAEMQNWGIVLIVRFWETYAFNLHCQDTY